MLYLYTLLKNVSQELIWEFHIKSNGPVNRHIYSVMTTEIVKSKTGSPIGALDFHDTIIGP